MENNYVPFSSEIKEIIKHTDIEYTFRMAFEGDVKPGQFFEVSIPKYGEAPISVSGIGEGTVDLTIRKVGKVTNEVFELYEGQHFFMRGPYGNGFDVNLYKGKELVVIAGERCPWRCCRRPRRRPRHRAVHPPAAGCAAARAFALGTLRQSRAGSRAPWLGRGQGPPRCR